MKRGVLTGGEVKAKTFTIVTTTIRVPVLLRAYALDAVRFQRQLDRFIVVGDKKTPADVGRFCQAMEDEFGIECVYLGEREQIEYLKNFPALGDFLPWNCIQRRNVGMLLAYQGQSDVVVTIDDDNFLCQPDYLGFHSHLGELQAVDAVSSSTGWWNVCEMLQESRSTPFYHRGFPLSKRWSVDEEFRVFTRVNGRAVVSAGLWLDDPDVDAITRLCLRICATGPSDVFRERIACDIGTWSPFNSQNTALLREAIGGYFLFPFIGRYDDIWASYVMRHIADHFGDLVTYGSPLVRQKRNEHNYFKDFDAERFGLEQTDVFLEALGSCRLTAKTFREAFSEIAEQFPEALAKACESNTVEPALFSKVVAGYRVWAETIASIR